MADSLDRDVVANLEPVPWTKGIAPRYIALFLLIIFQDQIARRTLAVGGLVPSVVGVTIGGALAFLLLFYPPAIRGFRAQRGLVGIGSSTFGARGSIWLPGLLLGLVEIVWFALALAFAAELAFRALASFGLLDPAYLLPSHWEGLSLSGPYFFAVVLAWSIASAVIGTLAFRLAAAVMAGYQPLIAIAIGLVAVWAMPGLVGFQPLDFDPVTAEPVADPTRFAFVQAIQFVFAFFATFGAMGADWGASSRSEGDVRRGGFVGVAFASTVLATLALMIVAGANGREPTPEGLKAAQASQELLSQARAGAPLAGSPESAAQAVRELNGQNFSVMFVIQHGLGGLRGGIILMILSFSLLGPACFAPQVIGQRFSAVWPSLPRWAWSMIGAVATWPILALRWHTSLETVFSLLGALFAPVVGALLADSVRQRGRWLGPRLGINPVGWIAWMFGVVVGLVPVVGPWLGLASSRQFQPAALFAFLTAFWLYLILAAFGLESPLKSEKTTSSAVTETPAIPNGTEPT